MGDQLVMKVEFAGLIEAVKALSDQIAALITTTTAQMASLTTTTTTLTTKVDNRTNNNDNNNNTTNNRNNPNRGGGSISVIRVLNNNHTIVTYRKSEHSHESDLEYYERRYYIKLKDDYYKFKISGSIYRCLFCYNKDYSLTDLLIHASRMPGNSRKTIKDIAKHYVLITYIQRYFNVKFDETFIIINNKITEINNASVVEKNLKRFRVFQRWRKLMQPRR